MTANKTVVEKYMEGFRNSDHAMILSCLTDDVIWDIPGYVRLQGKEQFDKEIENENFEGKPIISITRLVEENDIVVAEGTVQTKMKNGDVVDLLFCDVFHFRDGKIKQLTSYLVQKK
jgi:ketosteroid isomerase-like protein